MTFEELDATLPNGFHDAFLLNLELDYGARVARMRLDVWIGDTSAPAGPERELRRTALVDITGLQSCAIEPPDPTYPYTTLPWIDIADSSAGPSGFETRLFVTQWNAFISIAAADASLRWEDEAASGV